MVQMSCLLNCALDLNRCDLKILVGLPNGHVALNETFAFNENSVSTMLSIWGRRWNSLFYIGDAHFME